MGKKQTSKVFIYAGFAAIAAIIGVMVVLQVSNVRNLTFKQSWDNLGFEVISLTQEYQAEERKWSDKQYDDAQMVGIIDVYSAKYQSLIDRAKTLDTPERYAQARDLLVKAIETEKQSNEHFKAFLLTGDQKEKDRSSDMFSLSLRYSAEADAAIKAAG
jgi:hypothetical protein